MAPAQLPLRRRDPVVGGPAVGDQDPSPRLTQQVFGRLGTPAGTDQKDGHQPRDADPQPRLLLVLAPTGLVRVGALLLLGVLMRFLERCRQGPTHLPLRLGY